MADMLLALRASPCDAQNVTYDHRVDDPANYNYCPVPGGGADALLYASLAVAVSCVLYHRLSAVWVLLAGAAFQLTSFYFNLGHFSNAATIWLGMTPSTIFFFIFLPPLLLDEAVRIDFFHFKKVMTHVLLFAFFNVLVTAAAMIPILLYGLGLAAAGWRPIDVALFSAMLAATDAVAVAAILKAGGAPEMLALLLEGESLFNDASSIVLFEIFFKMAVGAGGSHGGGSLGSIVAVIGGEVLYLAVMGAVGGVLVGVVTQLLYKFLHKRHMPPVVEVSLSLSGAYFTYLFTEVYLHGSGVIGVVIYGLYGSATFTYGLSSTARRRGTFYEFWDVVSFVANGVVFFFVGSSIVNFIIRIVPELYPGNPWAALTFTLAKLPWVLAANFGLRWLLIMLEAFPLSFWGPLLSWQEVLFSAVGGLRGGLALILANTVLSHSKEEDDPKRKAVNATMVLWTAGFALFTLLVNAPLLGPLMRVLKLNTTSAAIKAMHKHAKATLVSHTRKVLTGLKEDDDEIWRGVDWSAVSNAALELEDDVVQILDKAQQEAAAPAAAPLPLTRSVTAASSALDWDSSDGWDEEADVEQQALASALVPQGSKSFIAARINQQEALVQRHLDGLMGAAAAVAAELGDTAARRGLVTGQDVVAGDLAAAAAAGGSGMLDGGALDKAGSGYDSDATGLSEAGSVHPPHLHGHHRCPFNPLLVVQTKDMDGKLLPQQTPATAMFGGRGGIPEAGVAGGKHLERQISRKQNSSAMFRRLQGQAVWAPILGQVSGAGDGGDENALPTWAVPLLDNEDDQAQALAHDELLTEQRAALLAGFKRHFHYKAREGLLSSTGLRTLCWACDACLAHPNRPIDLWARVQQSISQSWVTRQLCELQLWTGRQHARLICRSGDHLNGGRGDLRMELLRAACQMLRQSLGYTRAISLEVALELWLALTESQQARAITRGEGASDILLAEELAEQARRVWELILDREVEDPEEFSAIQTHRATLGVLRQQLGFMEQLVEVGGVEESAGEELHHALEKSLQRLERRGPVWRVPGITELLKQQPWLAGLPEEVVLWLRAYGELRSYSAGQCIIPPKRTGPPGIYMVLTGLCRLDAARGSVHSQRFYVGVGGLFGFVSSMVGHCMPGMELLAVYAQGNALGGGPLLFVLPPRVLLDIRKRAAGLGVSTEVAQAFGQLLVNMYRQAGLLVFERFSEALSAVLLRYLRSVIQELRRVCDHSRDAHAAELRLRHQLDALLRPGVLAAAAAGSSVAPEELLDVVQLLAGEPAANQVLRDCASAAMASLRDALLTAEVVALAPGDTVRQETFMLLLDGTLSSSSSSLCDALAHTHVRPAAPSPSAAAASGSSSGSGDGAAANGAPPAAAAAAAAAPGSSLHKVAAPAVLGWAPEVMDCLGSRCFASSVTYRAGSAGALLLVSTRLTEDLSGAEAPASPKAPPPPAPAPPPPAKGKAAAAPPKASPKGKGKAQEPPAAPAAPPPPPPPSQQQQQEEAAMDALDDGDEAAAAAALRQGPRLLGRMTSKKPLQRGEKMPGDF